MGRVSGMEHVQDGYKVFTLSSERIRLALVPGLGGKVISMVDKAADRDWINHDTGPVHLRGNEVGEAFEHSLCMGIDECIPTVASCRLDGKTLPDHGEVWARAWQIMGPVASNEVTLSVDLSDVPLRLSRTIRLHQETVTLSYELENLSPKTVRYLWCIHPLFPYRTGDRLVIDADQALYARVEYVEGLPGIQQGSDVLWPSPKPGIELDQFGICDHACIKLFLPSRGINRIRVLGQSGSDVQESVEVDYGPKTVLPYLGVWLNQGGWHGQYNYALEPTNALGDSLQDAIGHSRSTPQVSIGPNEVRAWHVTYTFS